MVSSTCSSASIESAPAGFLGLTADGGVDVVTDAENSQTLLLRPLSVDISAYPEIEQRIIRMNSQSANFLPLLSSSNNTLMTLDDSKTKGKARKSSFSKLASISRRGRFDSTFRLVPDYYPLPRWRPIRNRKNSANYTAADLKQLSEKLREYERQNKRKSVIRFFNG